MTAMIAVSAAIFAIDKPYTYRIPTGMNLLPGMRVTVPFGRGNRHCEGMVLSVTDDHTEGLKSVEKVLDADPVMSEAQLRMAAFIRERYFCTFYDAIKSMLPAGLWFQSREWYSLKEETPDTDAVKAKSEHAWRILACLLDRGGRADRSQLSELFQSGEELDGALNWLKKTGVITSDVDYNQKIRDKTEKIASLNVSVEETMQYAERKTRSAPMQYEVLKLLCAIGSGSTKDICYLTGANMTTVKRLEALGYLKLDQREVFRNSLPDFVKPAEELVLNEAQEVVFRQLQLQSSEKQPGVALLHGVTGSGKTAVYIKLLQKTLKEGRSAILLVPEIALTPQLIQLLMSHFGKEVAVLHSALRISERYDEWKRIRSGHAHIVVGTRSAVFAPVEELGLVIVDEEQEHTYKSENTPRYHARELAIYRGSRDRALVLLGSATPSLESMYLAKTGVYKLYTLQERYNGRDLPDVELVDMRQELRNGNSGSISARLRELLAKNIADGRQSILFLNRRGAGRCMICVDCGEVVMCPRCSVSLTYHAANGRLMCHHCGYSQPADDRCDKCGGHMKVIGTGTQKIQQELETLFPGVEVLRMDADTISAVNSHDVALTRFEKEKIPILIGTQMVTKGLNFENVTLVGILDADGALYVDHYRAAETTFSILTQVVGRAGRGIHCGHAVVQTMTPEHSVIQLAAKQDFSSFYDLEITLRRLQNAPPFGDVFVITFVGAFEGQTADGAHLFRSLLETALRSPEYRNIPARLLGPSPASITKINNAFRYRLTLHCGNQKQIRQLLAHLLRVFSKSKKSKGVFAFIDINGYE